MSVVSWPILISVAEAWLVDEVTQEVKIIVSEEKKK